MITEDFKLSIDASEARPVVIVGLGKTGLSCARFLQERGIAFRVVDSRSEPPGLKQFEAEFAGVPVELGPFPDNTLAGAAALIVSPGVSLKEPAISAARARGVPVTGDIDLFSRLAKAPVIAVTGSNGKSTVVSLVAEICRAGGLSVGLGGNLDGDNARPALDMLREGEPARDVYVLELSSFQLESTEALGAEVAAILNLSEDHMDRYDTLEEYLAAKQRIFRGAGKVVINRDCPYSRPPANEELEAVEFGLGEPAEGAFGLRDINGVQTLCFGNQPLITVPELKIVGRHNVANALAAMAIGHVMGISLADSVRAVSGFRGLPHRCQWVASVDGVDYYNDSKGTNVGATVAAIEGLGESIRGRILLIAGGVGKGADFSPLQPVVKRFVGAVILIGEAAGELAAVLKDQTRILFARDMDAAVDTARSASQPGDAVLLSPACASFDMFTDFNHRGRVFADAVGRLQ